MPQKRRGRLGGGLAPRRPEGWSPDWVLEKLKENPEVSLKKQANEWAELCMGTADALLAEVRRWKKFQPEFAEALAVYVKPGYHVSRDDVDGAWRQKFILAYRIRHNRVAAAQAVGIPFSTILRKLDRKCAEFDDKFHQMVTETDAEVLEAGREAINVGMTRLIASAPEDAKAADAAVRHGIAIAERLDPTVWGKKDKLQVDVNFHIPVHEKVRALGRVEELSRIGRRDDDVIEGQIA